MGVQMQNAKIKGPHIAEVLDNFSIASDVKRLVLNSKIIAKDSKPGQFVSILCEDLILRRPFSLAKANEETIEIIYKVRGQGTKYIAGLQKGDSVNLIGALGNGFTTENKNSLLIGCGVGFAPVAFLSDVMQKSGIKHTLLGCFQTAIDLENMQNISLITEDGTAGLKGRLDSHLENIINDIKPEKIYTCGPNPAMAYIVKTAEKYKIPTEVALEREFACGTGVCMGCVIKVMQKDEAVNKRICKDGPVFDGSEVIWE